MYVNARGMRYKLSICNDKTKRFESEIEESEEGDRQIRCLQHNPEKTKHRCSPENRPSNGEPYAVQRSEKQVGGEPSFLLSVRSKQSKPSCMDAVRGPSARNTTPNFVPYTTGSCFASSERSARDQTTG